MAKKKEKGKLLIVDDDMMILKLLSVIFSKLYDVKTAASAEDALIILDQGFIPGVILSDQVMPGMSGAEFLEQCSTIVPDSIRIILTGHNESKLIIEALNKAKAFMFVTKPWKNLDLFQSANIAFKHYYNTLEIRTHEEDLKHKNEELRIYNITLESENFELGNENIKSLSVIDQLKLELLNKQKEVNSSVKEKKKNAKTIKELNSKLSKQHDESASLSKELKDTNTKLDDVSAKAEEFDKIHDEYETMKVEYDSMDSKIAEKQEELNKIAKLYLDNENFPQQAIEAFASLLRESNKFYFNDHTFSVARILKSITTEIGMDSAEARDVVVAGLLHSYATMGMPDYYLIVNPNDLKYRTNKEYFTYFYKNLDYMNGIDLMRVPAKYISQMWEHHDGSGFPTHMGGFNIAKGSQLLTFANMYHLMVYGLTAEQLAIVKQKGEVIQKAVETRNRHKDFVQYMFSNSKWFDIDLFRSFHDLIKNKECDALVPDGRDLTLDLRSHYRTGSVVHDSDDV